MQFLYPGFLTALALISVPVIIHLFNFRKFKKIYFTNVKFLREIKQDTQSRSRLKHLLILCCRILAFTFLVFAFTQPYIRSGNTKSASANNVVSIYIDNSFSMDAQGKNGSLLETARKNAREIALAFKPSDQFQILTTDFEPRHQRIITREEFLQMVDEIKPGSSVHTLSEILQRQEDALSSGNNQSAKKAYIISDFQKSNTDESLSPDSGIEFSLLPLEASVRNNIYVDTCFVSTPFVQLNLTNDLTVVIKNNSSQDIENIPVKLSINEIQKALATVSAPANSSAEVHLSFSVSESGWQRAEISLTDFPVTFDDNYFFSFKVRQYINILNINSSESTSAVNSVFGNDNYFQLKNIPVGQIDYSSFSTSQLIIINEINSFSSGMIHEITNYINSGGTVFIIPSDNAEINSYNELFNSIQADNISNPLISEEKVVSIESKNELFSNVFENKKAITASMDLPVVNKYFPVIHTTRSSEQRIMKLQSGNDFLTSSGSGKGKLYFLTSSLQSQSSGFARHALFVPIMLRAALQGSSEINPPLVVGKDHDFGVTDTLISNDNIFHLKNERIKFDIIPESRILNSNTIISVFDQVHIAENYDLLAGNNLISVSSFNYDRKESDLNILTAADLNRIITNSNSKNINVIGGEKQNLSKTISEMNEGIRLWKYCILLTLFFLFAEVFLIRFFKRQLI